MINRKTIICILASLILSVDTLGNNISNTINYYSTTLDKPIEEYINIIDNIQISCNKEIEIKEAIKKISQIDFSQKDHNYYISILEQLLLNFDELKYNQNAKDFLDVVSFNISDYRYDLEREKKADKETIFLISFLEYVIMAIKEDELNEIIPINDNFTVNDFIKHDEAKEFYISQGKDVREQILA